MNLEGDPGSGTQHPAGGNPPAGSQPPGNLQGQPQPAPPPGKGSGQPAPQPGADGAGQDPFSGLRDEGNRALAKSKGWQGSDGLERAVTSYRELEVLQGKMVMPVGPDATPEQRDKFAKAVGRPETADGYKFALPATYPASVPYDEKTAVTFKGWAHKAGLAPWQAQLVHDEAVQMRLAEADTARKRVDEAVGTAHQAILKEWGPEDGEAYKRNSELANRALRNLGLLDTYKRIGLLTPEGFVTDPGIAFSLAKVGAGLYAEDSQYGGPGSMPNPWKDGEENLKEQGRILRQDPKLAETLMRAAGKDPSKEIWTPPGRRVA